MDKLKQELKRAPKEEFTQEEKEDLEIIAKVLRSDPRFEEKKRQQRARAH